MSQFITKDSGVREEFASGMKRDTAAGKTLYHLVYDGPMFKRWAGLLTRGAVKYDPGNWMKAEGQAEWNRFRESAVRHFVQWYYGETDEDHGAAVMFNINGKEYVEDKMKRDTMPTAAEIGHAKDTQQRFLAGLEADTNDFEYDEARKLSTYEEIDAILADANELVIPLDPWEYDRGQGVDLDKCGTIDGVTEIWNPFAVLDTRPEPYLVKDYAPPSFATMLSDSFGRDLVQQFETLQETLWVTPANGFTAGFDLGLGSDGTGGVIVQRSIPKAEAGVAQFWKDRGGL